jgi:tRNA-dihydrouridine synthase
LIPQLLSNNAKDFKRCSEKIRELGYRELNLNLGCPSGTVVAKGKGSGFLAKRAELEAFLDEIFDNPVTEISIKTRIGKDQPEEFYKLIEIYNKFPMKELIIHPRIQKDFYKNKPNLEIFQEALQLSKSPVCYNGDIFTLRDYTKFTESYPEVNTIMLGRGLLSNPWLIKEIASPAKPEAGLLKQFHDRIYEDYQKVLSGDTNVLFKMKELWVYLIALFPDSEKYAKKIKKAQSLKDYEEAADRLFKEIDISKK